MYISLFDWWQNNHDVGTLADAILAPALAWIDDHILFWLERPIEKELEKLDKDALIAELGAVVDDHRAQLSQANEAVAREQASVEDLWIRNKDLAAGVKELEERRDAADEERRFIVDTLEGVIKAIKGKLATTEARVEELLANISFLLEEQQQHDKCFGDARQHISQLEQENQRLREGLTFYADKEKWVQVDDAGDYIGWVFSFIWNEHPQLLGWDTPAEDSEEKPWDIARSLLDKEE